VLTVMRLSCGASMSVYWPDAGQLMMGIAARNTLPVHQCLVGL